MRAQELTFSDNYFTHSSTNFVVANLDDPDVAMKHIYRTPKPGEGYYLYLGIHAVSYTTLETFVTIEKKEETFSTFNSLRFS